MDLDRREPDVADGGDERRIAAREASGIDDGAGEALIVRRVKAVDDLALDVGMENLDLDAELLGEAADPGVVLRQFHRAEDLDLRLAAHVHAGAVDDQNFHGAGVS